MGSPPRSPVAIGPAAGAEVYFEASRPTIRPRGVPHHILAAADFPAGQEPCKDRRQCRNRSLVDRSEIDDIRRAVEVISCSVPRANAGRVFCYLGHGSHGLPSQFLGVVLKGSCRRPCIDLRGVVNHPPRASPDERRPLASSPPTLDGPHRNGKQLRNCIFVQILRRFAH